MTTIQILLPTRHSGTTAICNTSRTKMHMKDWVHKGIYQIKDILDDQNNLIPFQELENLVGRDPHRLLEYNAVNTTLQQARQHSRLHLSNNSSKEDSHNMTLNGTPVTSLGVKDFRQLLTEDTTVLGKLMEEKVRHRNRQ